MRGTGVKRKVDKSFKTCCVQQLVHEPRLRSSNVLVSEVSWNKLFARGVSNNKNNDTRHGCINNHTRNSVLLFSQV